MMDEIILSFYYENYRNYWMTWTGDDCRGIPRTAGSISKQWKREASADFDIKRSYCVRARTRNNCRRRSSRRGQTSPHCRSKKPTSCMSELPHHAMQYAPCSHRRHQKRSRHTGAEHYRRSGEIHCFQKEKKGRNTQLEGYIEIRTLREYF